MVACIVGNGPIDSKGAEIDSHDLVIRMHHSPIEHLEKDVGSKLHTWVAPRGFIRDWMNIPSMWPQEVWSFNQGEKNKELVTKFPQFQNRIVVASKGFVKSVYDKVPRHPTKGLLTVFFALESIPPPIYIIGFSFYERPEAFFWDQKEKLPPSENDPQVEKEILYNLREQGLVEFI